MKKNYRVTHINNKKTKEEFLKNVFDYLDTNPNTPIDIFEAEFKEIQEYTVGVLYATATSEITYSVSIGYHRKVEYYENNTRKEKIVTDWRPITGTYSDTSSYAMLEEGNDGMYIALSSVIYESDESNWEYTGEEVEVSDSDIDDALGYCASITAHHAEMELPGDEQKQFCPSLVHQEVDDILYFKLPCYSIQYIYKGETYTIRGVAINTKTVELNAECPVSANTISSLKENGTPEIVKLREQKDSKWKEVKLFGIVAVLTLGLIIPAIIFGFLTYKKYKEFKQVTDNLDNVLDEFEQKLSSIKHEQYERKLKQYNLVEE